MKSTIQDCCNAKIIALELSVVVSYLELCIYKLQREKQEMREREKKMSTECYIRRHWRGRDYSRRLNYTEEKCEEMWLFC